MSERIHLETVENEDMGYSIYQIGDNKEDLEVWLKIGFVRMELPPGLIDEFIDMLGDMQIEVLEYAHG